MSVKVFVIVATFLGKSFGLPFDSNTSAIVRTELPDIHKPVTLGSTPYLPLLKFNDTVYYYGVILGCKLQRTWYFGHQAKSLATAGDGSLLADRHITQIGLKENRTTLVEMRHALKYFSTAPLRR
ncbi:unnamed protein product [Acanthoscelides obtectus]|uniref:Uncharacterized protein n=1 Tax=Acanthoscelides obtectus TaxID=200917 RepID=A0A9P0NYV9_ACAOB|nr:unnamed protein product [Acanthoscelides obtectus]CAK1668494.1 hypothetical protein AOBTE_LOCUS26436 [Acanthoscelides obtectus]